MQVLGVECWVLGVGCIYIYIYWCCFNCNVLGNVFVWGLGFYFLYYVWLWILDFGFWCLEAKLAFRSLI